VKTKIGLHFSRPICDTKNRLSNNTTEQLLARYSRDLAASLERLQITQNSMDAASEQILWADCRGRIIYSNSAVTEALGYSPVELASMTVHELTPHFPAIEWADFWELLKRDRAIIKEWSERRHDGSVLPVEAKLTYMNAGGNEYAVAFIRDITERKQAEERRLQMERQMQHVQRLESVGVLAGGIAHDFNNMLMAILGNIILAKGDVAPASETHELLIEAENAALNAQNLTGQLLTFAKGSKPIKSVVSVGAVIRN
jgi:PAS domain S-box-containing protein